MSEGIPPVGPLLPARNASRSGGRPPRFGMPVLIQRLRAYKREADERRDPATMDRRRALKRLAQELDADEALLLERGFDKAYRRVVEGL